MWELMVIFMKLPWVQKSKNTKHRWLVELNLKRENGWLYYIKRNPGVIYDIVGDRKKARYPEESVLEVWRNLESSEYGVSDMTKKEILEEILEDWEFVSESMTDQELDEDRDESIKHSKVFR